MPIVADPSWEARADLSQTGVNFLATGKDCNAQVVPPSSARARARAQGDVCNRGGSRPLCQGLLIHVDPILDAASLRKVVRLPLKALEDFDKAEE